MTDGAFSDDGAFRPLETWDADAVMKLFRERLLARLIERHAISEELARRLLAWRHPGFSAHVGKAIPFEDKKAIEDVACYIVRNPLSLKANAIYRRLRKYVTVVSLGAERRRTRRHPRFPRRA